MSLVLNLPPELESALAAEASRSWLALPDYVLRLLVAGRGPSSTPQTGPDLVAYWQGDGLVGTRPDITDSAEHARGLRQQAEHRDRG